MLGAVVCKVANAKQSLIKIWSRLHMGGSADLKSF